MILRFFSVPKHILIVAIIGTLVAVALNEINASYINSPIPYQHGLVNTADEGSYIAPARNFMQIGEWRDNSDGLTAYYQRPPGYGILYVFNYLLLGKHAFVGIKIVQIFAFFVGILLFWKSLRLLNINEHWSFMATLLFALLPCYSGFIYFSITEGITPFLVIWSTFELLKASKEKPSFVGLTLSNAFLLLVRPQLAILPLIALIYFLLKRKPRVMIWMLLAFLPITAWYVRTAVISQEVPSLHPIYSETNNHLFRPTHAAMTDLYRVWEQRSDVFHTHIGKIAYGDSSQIEVVVKELPAEYQAEMRPILQRYHALNHYQFQHFADQHLIHTFKGEAEFIADANQLRKKLIAEHPLDYYVKTPAKSAKDFLNKSYLNLYIFQAPFRGNMVVEFLRILCWIIIITSILLTFCLPFLLSWKKIEVAIVVGLGIFLFYLVFVQRLNEERYIVPILPLFLLYGVVSIKNILLKKAKIKG